MRDALRQLTNGILARCGLRVVNAKWGPRGFAESFRKAQASGFSPNQILDIGAAGGLWTQECLGVFPDANYFLVDPLEENAPALHALRASHPNVEFWIGAAGSKNGELSMRIHGDQSSFFPSEFGNGGLTRSIPVRPLDSFLGDLIGAPPRLLKADVQGFELEVLKGAARCIEGTEVLLLEVSFRRIYAHAPLAHEVIASVGAMGFRIYDICTYATRPRDNVLAQADLMFVRDNSQLFAFEGYA